MEFEMTRVASFRPGEDPDPRSTIAHGDPAEAFRMATVRVRRRDRGSFLGALDAGPGIFR